MLPRKPSISSLDWDEVLGQLETLQTTGEAPSSTGRGNRLGHQETSAGRSRQRLSWDARKKIDICYHELSPVGYFQMLQAAGLAVSLVDLEEVERAVRTPPPAHPPRCAATTSANSRQMLPS